MAAVRVGESADAKAAARPVATGDGLLLGVLIFSSLGRGIVPARGEAMEQATFRIRPTGETLSARGLPRAASAGGRSPGRGGRRRRGTAVARG